MMKPLLKKAKQTILTASLFLSGFAFGQVGVNTSTPKTTFDINAKRDGSGTITDNTQIIGLQAPRLTRAELTANTATYGTNQNGALIYITDISGGDAASGTQRENITSLGYYYFDAATASGSGRWVKMAVGNGGSLYTANNGLTMTGNNTKLGGTLIENTTIAQGNNSMTFSGNSNVNITTTNASGYPLSIIHPLSGSISQPGLQIGGASGTAATGQAAFIGFNPNNGQGAWPISVGAQYISGSAGQGAADFFVATSSGGAADKKLIVKNSGDVGIGTTAPTSKLSVNGTADKPGGGSWGTFSDARVKKDIRDYQKGLKEILAIRPVTFEYNGKSPFKADGKTYVGVIAQEIEKVLPSTVTKTKYKDLDDLREYNGSELTYTLINAVKEQQAEIEQMKKDHKELFELKVLVKNLQAEIEKLKKDK